MAGLRSRCIFPGRTFVAGGSIFFFVRARLDNQVPKKIGRRRMESPSSRSIN